MSAAVNVALRSVLEQCIIPVRDVQIHLQLFHQLIWEAVIILNQPIGVSESMLSTVFARRGPGPLGKVFSITGLLKTFD